MQILRKAANFCPPIEYLKEIYTSFVRSILEQSSSVWHSSITEENSTDLERVQKSALRIILRKNYTTYEQALAQLGLESLKSRRETLCLKFARKCLNNEKLKHMFPKNLTKHDMNTRKNDKFKVQFANTGRLQKSPIIYMQNLLNQEEHKNIV